MRVTYYPGCSLESTAEEYKVSLLEAFRSMGIDLVELDDWNCCGATSAHSLDFRLGISLPARNLLLASETTDLMLTPCAACYNRQKTAATLLSENSQLKEQIERGLNRRFRQTVRVQNILEFLSERIELLKAKVKRPLSHLKAVCYYGCLLTRPPQITNEPNYEDPQSMDIIVRALGAHPIDWSFKTECCGGSLSIARKDIVIRLVSKIFRMARETEADAIITACPLCQMNLDTRQREAEALTGEKYRIPILFLSELMAAAFGYERMRDLERRHLVDPAGVLGKRAEASSHDGSLQGAYS